MQQQPQQQTSKTRYVITLVRGSSRVVDTLRVMINGAAFGHKRDGYKFIFSCEPTKALQLWQGLSILRSDGCDLVMDPMPPGAVPFSPLPASEALEAPQPTLSLVSADDVQVPAGLDEAQSAAFRQRILVIRRGLAGEQLEGEELAIYQEAVAAADKVVAKGQELPLGLLNKGQPAQPARPAFSSAMSGVHPPHPSHGMTVPPQSPPMTPTPQPRSGPPMPGPRTATFGPTGSSMPGAPTYGNQGAGPERVGTGLIKPQERIVGEDIGWPFVNFRPVDDDKLQRLKRTPPKRGAMAPKKAIVVRLGAMSDRCYRVDHVHGVEARQGKWYVRVLTPTGPVDLPNGTRAHHWADAIELIRRYEEMVVK